MFLQLSSALRSSGRSHDVPRVFEQVFRGCSLVDTLEEVVVVHLIYAITFKLGIACWCDFSVWVLEKVLQGPAARKTSLVIILTIDVTHQILIFV